MMAIIQNGKPASRIDLAFRPNQACKVGNIMPLRVISSSSLLPVNNVVNYFPEAEGDEQE